MLTVRLEGDSFRYLANVHYFPKTTNEEEPSRMEELRTTYLYPVFIAGMLQRTWDSPVDLDPSVFSVFFTTLEKRGLDLGGYPLDEAGDPMVPATEFEESIQRYFNVSSERLRSSVYYRPDTKTYPWFGLGGVSDCIVTSAQRDKKHLTLDYEVIYDGLLVTQTGTLLLDMESDGGYKYASNKAAENPQVYTRAGQFIFDVGFYQCGEIVNKASSILSQKRSSYDSAAVLQSDDLFGFFLDFYETPEAFYQSAAKQYVFPVSAITDFLDRFFEGYRFDIAEVTVPVTLKDGMVTCERFTGSDTPKQQAEVTAVTVMGEDQLRIDATLTEPDAPETVSSTVCVTIQVTETGYHILSLNRVVSAD